MEILYYSIAIVIVAVAIVLFFVFRAKKHDKELEKFKNEIKTSVDINMQDMSLAPSQEKTAEEEQEVLENFSLEEKQENDKKDSNKEPIKKTAFPDLEDEEDNEDDEIDKEFERRFAEFKKYMSMDEDEQDTFDENEEDDEDFFDIDNLKNKTKEEVLEEIKNLPPEAQEIILKHYEEINNQDN